MATTRTMRTEQAVSRLQKEYREFNKIEMSKETLKAMLAAAPGKSVEEKYTSITVSRQANAPSDAAKAATQEPAPTDTPKTPEPDPNAAQALPASVPTSPATEKAPESTSPPQETTAPKMSKADMEKLHEAGQADDEATAPTKAKTEKKSKKASKSKLEAEKAVELESRPGTPSGHQLAGKLKTAEEIEAEAKAAADHTPHVHPSLRPIDKAECAETNEDGLSWHVKSEAARLVRVADKRLLTIDELSKLPGFDLSEEEMTEAKRIEKAWNKHTSEWVAASNKRKEEAALRQAEAANKGKGKQSKKSELTGDDEWDAMVAAANTAKDEWDALVAKCDAYRASKKQKDSDTMKTTSKSDKTTSSKKSDKKSDKKSNPSKSGNGTHGHVKAEIFGFAATAVLRAMGKAGMSHEEARKALDKFGGKNINDATVKIQVRAGVKGERGDPANLTKAQLKELKAAGK